MKLIHDLLGLPTGGIDILSIEQHKSEPNLNGIFRNQFDKKKMRPKDVMKLIKDSGDAAGAFQINFLVLFVNLMVDCNRMGCCNLSFLSSIKDLKMIPEIDWCKFIYDMLKTSKDSWSRSSDVCFYAGPLTYLTLLYVESTIWPDEVVDHMRPATRAWSFDMLKKREAWEIANGGLGSAQLLDVTREVEREVEIKMIKDMICHVFYTRRDIEQRLIACKAKYQGDEDFKALSRELNDIFRSSTQHDSGHTATTDIVDPAAVGESIDIVVGKRTGHETPIDNEMHQSPLSQYWLSQTLHKICDETVEKSLSSKKQKQSITLRPPQFDLGISPTKTAEPSTVTNPTSKDKGKGVCIVDDAKLKKSNRFTGCQRRSVRLGDHLRSPYVRRFIDMKVSAEDRRIHEWAIAEIGSTFDIVFELENSTTILRGNLTSLASKCIVYTNVIDGWAELLNMEEMFRSRDSPRRFFFNTTVLGDPKLWTRQADFNVQHDIFSNNLAKSVRFDMEVIKMRNMDLAFFPVMDCEHYYLVVFNFKNPSIVVIDNRFWKGCQIEDDLGLHEHVVDLLHRFMIKHLRAIGHPSWQEMDETGHDRLEMSWQTKDNLEDGGVFLMRHMETWMGEERSWKTGFTTEGQNQRTQLTDLRKKYTAKLVLSNFSKRRESIVREVDQFHAMDTEDKKKL